MPIVKQHVLIEGRNRQSTAVLESMQELLRVQFQNSTDPHPQSPFLTRSHHKRQFSSRGGLALGEGEVEMVETGLEVVFITLKVVIVGHY